MSDSRDASAAGELETLALFPLSNVVLFPRIHCPLHVFEPRYRQMLAAVLDGERRIGMVTVRPEAQGEMAGDPPIFEIGCAGAVQRDERREDGRTDILLLGTDRFRVVEELPRTGDRLYRIARVQPLCERFDEAREGVRLQALRASAVELLERLLRRVAPESAHQFDPRRFAGIDDATFVSALCQMLELSPVEKQGLLEAEGPTRRCEDLIALLQFRIAELGGAAMAPRGLVH